MPDPVLDIRLKKAPCPANLEGGDLLRCSQPVDRPLRDLQVFGDLLDGEDFTLTGTCRHGNDQFRANLDRIVQNFQGINDKWLELAERGDADPLD